MLRLLIKDRRQSRLDELENRCREQQRRHKIERYLKLRQYRAQAHEAFVGLHPTVILSRKYDLSEPKYERHQRLKNNNDPDYCRKIPVLVAYARQKIMVEIDSWQDERQNHWDLLSDYGCSQLKDLLGPDACDELSNKTRWHYPDCFFGNYLFSMRNYDAAVRLANFAARRDQFPDFRYWFAAANG